MKIKCALNFRNKKEIFQIEKIKLKCINQGPLKNLNVIIVLLINAKKQKNKGKEVVQDK